MTDQKKDINWMYEGTKSLVNREDYLLGKKVRLNFPVMIFVLDR